ncbi:OLC1v1022552C1 [Oldenlandia corymbosa var. corymbosa]|uniref:OLC1v1022552C1 n=1 Tax=Oldenlandia corymbosa var. corymbosa TaxID=529605 RepID=A0AAV1BYR9_OLDCO|nr:OLC1v1022552C1 [Oldenlandia corymbosa var. corymbosa]
MLSFLQILTLFSLIIPLYSSPTPLHFIKRHSFHKNAINSQPQQYFQVTRPLPFDSLNTSCTLPIVTHNFSNTYGLPPVSVPYSPPLNCPWTDVVLEIQVSCQGEQYDRIAGVWLSGRELIRTSTAEPTEDGIFWVVRKDVTRYSSLLAQENLTLSMMLENIVNDYFTGVYQVNVTFLYYDTSPHPAPAPATAPAPDPDSFDPLIVIPGEDEFYYRTSRKLKSVEYPLSFEVNYEKGSFELYDRPADLILPISSSGIDGFWFRIQNESDIHSKRVEIPPNTYRAVIEVFSSAHGDDEFWYSNPPDAYLLNVEAKESGSKRGHGAYREVLVKIDGDLVGSVVPFPVIFTGGINPLFWEPVVGIGAFDLPSYDLELTPFLGLLLDGKPHSFTFEVADGISFWLVDANLHLWLDAGLMEVQACIGSSEPEFTLERESKFDGLGGKFEVEAERKAKISGWMNMAAGYFTTSFEQKVKLENTVKYYNNGLSKLVEQKVKDKSEFTIKSGNGEVIFYTSTKREYPLKLNTVTLPGREENTYQMTTKLETSIEEKKTVGESSSTLKDRQECNGWMLVKDHDVLSGGAYTHQNYSFKDAANCYSRIVVAENGAVLGDSSSLLCVHSL